MPQRRPRQNNLCDPMHAALHGAARHGLVFGELVTSAEEHLHEAGGGGRITMQQKKRAGDNKVLHHLGGRATNHPCATTRGGGALCHSEINISRAGELSEKMTCKHRYGGALRQEHLDKKRPTWAASLF